VTYLTVRNTRDDVGRERTYSLLTGSSAAASTGYGLVAEMIEPELANRLTHAQMQRMINALDLKVALLTTRRPLDIAGRGTNPRRCHFARNGRCMPTGCPSRAVQ
jgi:hypothetical protein